MLELAILGLLQGRELHGYEIRKRLRDDLGLFSNVSFGSLYPALGRLERSGAVVGVVEPEIANSAPVPMTGSLGGERAAMRSRRTSATRGRRARKVYRITDEGRRQFAELLDSERDSDDGRSFGLRLAFARYLPPAARVRLLERRRASLAQRLEHARGAATGRERLDPYARSLVEHTTEVTEREISWIDRLLAAERAPGPGPALVTIAETEGEQP
jgi:DNA-binding PadR family transcriptional regulator